MAFMKIGMGLGMGNRFFDWARREYSWPKPSGLMTGAFALTIILALFTWYATLRYYVPYGWILTAFVTLMAAYVLAIWLNWKTMAPKYLLLISRFEKRRPIWLMIGVFWGIVFLLMGLFLYR
jgi:hypothetical protein